MLGPPSWGDSCGRWQSNWVTIPTCSSARMPTILQIAEYYRLEKNSIGSLRSWMDRTWHVTDDALRQSKIYNHLIDLEFPFIYTIRIPLMFLPRWEP